MISNNEYQAIAELDLDPIKVKLMHKESGEGWSLQYANTIEIEYRRFLCLMKMFPNEPAAPMFDVDIFWHYHILDTMKYTADCASVFGYFLHHFPYVGLRGEEDEVTHRRVGARMKELYEDTFGEPYVRTALDELESVSSTFEQEAGAGAHERMAKGAAATPKTAFSFAVTKDAAASTPKTAFSFAVTKDAAASAPKTAFSFAVTADAAASAPKTAFSFAVAKDAAARTPRTAFSFAVSRDAAATSEKAASRLAVCNDAGAEKMVPLAGGELSPARGRFAAPLDIAMLKRLYFERPSLSAT